MEINDDRLPDMHEVDSNEDPGSSVCKCGAKVSITDPADIYKVALFGEFSHECVAEDWVQALQCPYCKNYISFFHDQKWWTKEELLSSTTSRTGLSLAVLNPRHEDLRIELIYQMVKRNIQCQPYKSSPMFSTPQNPLKEVTSRADHLVLYILSQIIYPQHDKHQEMAFLCSSKKDLAKVMWQDGEAAGFYTVKEKGTPYSGSQCDSYELPVVDLVYVQPQFQRKGLAMQMLDDIVNLYSNQDVGFSQPLSKPMTEVLWQFLCNHPTLRDHMWECSFTGGEGNRRNIWLHSKRLHRKRPLDPTPTQTDNQMQPPASS